jgi:hypothetical protein
MRRPLNKSQAYGYYGGVKERYVPGDVVDFEKQFLNQIPAELKKFLVTNAPNMLIRKCLSSDPGNIDTFVMSTSGKPEDVIYYQSDTDVVVLDDLAGSGISSDTAKPIDGGQF